MNDNETNRAAGYPADEDILRAVRRRLAAVEPMIPVPPAWSGHDLAPVRVRPVVRSGVRFAFAPLIIVAAVVAVALYGGMGGHPTTASSPSADYAELTYDLVLPSGETVGDAQLQVVDEIVKLRLQGAGIGTFTAITAATGRTVIQVPGRPDMAAIKRAMDVAGRFEFVLLPPEMYGTAQAPGSREIPALGATVDASLPAQFTGADLDPASVAAQLGTSQPGTWEIAFAFRAAKATEFATWTTQHVDDYFAMTLDRTVLSVPYIANGVTGGSGLISGAFTQTEAKAVALQVRFAAYGMSFKLLDSYQFTSSDASAAHPAITQPPISGAPTQAAAGAVDPGEPVFVLQTGDSGGPQVQVWLDFKCAACKNFHETVLPKLVADYVDTGKATIAFFDMTVIDQVAGGHESLDAANAAGCAANQGKYMEYADLLFANQGAEGDGSLTKDRLIALAAPLGLDQAAFVTCVRNGTYDAGVKASAERGPAMGITGVPAVAVEDRVTSDNSYETISKAIDALLAATPATTSPTTPAATPAAGRSPSSQPSAACSIAATRSGEPIASAGTCTGAGQPSAAASFGSSGTAAASIAP